MMLDTIKVLHILNSLHDKAMTANGMRMHAASGKPTADMHYFEGSAKAYADAFLVLHNALVPEMEQRKEECSTALLDLKYKYGDNCRIASITRQTREVELE